MMDFGSDPSVKNMDTESKYFQMEVIMKVDSKTGIFMVLGDLSITRVITMKECLLTIKLMGKELIHKLTGVSTKEVGKTMFRMGMERKFGAMVSNLRECSLMDSKKEKES